MIEVATGFAVIALAIAVGYVIARIGLLGEHAPFVLSRLTFFVLAPFLLFSVLSQADVATLFSAFLPVSLAAALIIIAIYWLIARFLFRRRVAETLIGSLSAGQVNSNNIGIPLSLYLLGDAAFPAPVILLQLLILTPISLAILDASTSAEPSLMRVLRRTARNPILIGSALGTLVSVTGINLPPIVVEPILLIANACVPVLLIAFGMSLYGQRVLGVPGRRRDIILASTLKLVFMPLVAWVLASFVFHLSAQEILVVTVLAALPTAQNVFNYSQRYGVGEVISRETVLITTIGCVPVLLLIMALLG